MTETDLERVARSAAGDLEEASAEEVLRWAAEAFGGRFCVTSSMADTVLVHLASHVRPGVDVLFLDTGYHFAETLGTRDAVAATYPVNVINAAPERTVAEQDAALGPRLYARDPDRCCALRKIAPLDRALEPYVAWASGIRRSETAARRGIRVVDWDERRGKIKINPLARWSDEDVEAYIAASGVLVNPLRSAGYPSIGCAPCTRRVGPGEDPRGGRWAGFGKTECGIHQ
ncbi:MAG: phosphoadenylyl-sulfate reductase [Streptosporangiaceae bacterium]